MSKRRYFKSLEQKLRARLTRAKAVSTPTPVATARPAKRPVVLFESLESRAMLAAVNWTGAGDGVNWSNVNNWSTLAMPSSADDVTIANASGAPAVQLAASTAVQSLNIGANTTLILTNSNTLTVTGGVNDDGVIKLGYYNGTSSNWGELAFSGSQTLSGTGSVLLDATTDSKLSAASAGSPSTLSIAQGITIHGRGTIQTTTTDAQINNEGVIRADAYYYTLTTAGNLNNVGTGVLGVSNYAQLMLGGNWTNTAQIDNSGGFVYFTTGDGASISGITTNHTYNVFSIYGSVTGDIHIDTDGAIWRVEGGSISNSVISSTGDPLLVNGGWFQGDTIAAGTTVVNYSYIVVTNGLTVNGSLVLGDSVSGYGTSLYAMDTQTIGGTGEVVFNSAILYAPNYIIAYGAPSTLTLGAGLTIHGGHGVITNNSPYNGIINQATIISDTTEVTGITVGMSPGSTATFINQGTIGATNGGLLQLATITNQGLISASDGGRIITSAAAITNSGEISITDDGILTTNYPLAMNSTGHITEDSTGRIVLNASLTGTTTNVADTTMAGSVRLSQTGTTSGSPQQIEVMSEDMGAVAAGFTGNFDYGNIIVATPFAKLVDVSDNANGSPEAMYTRTLFVASGSTLNLNGLNLYAEAANILGSVTNGTVTLVNVNASTTTDLSLSATNMDYGASTTLTATVTSGSGAVDGSVTFYDGSIPLGTVALDGSGQAAMTAVLSGGTRSIFACYTGSTNYDASFSPVSTAVVSLYTSSVGLSASALNVVTGQSITYTATLPVAPGGVAPAGSVSFLKNGVSFGTATINAAGVATLTTTTSDSAVGTFNITASYAGNANYTAAVSSASTLTVSKASTTITLTAGFNPTVGATIALSANIYSVSPASGGAVGTVTFYDGATVLAVVSTSNGFASLSTSIPTQTAGVHNLTAVYSGNADRFGSTSSVSVFNVQKTNSTTTLGVSPSSTTYGTSVTLTATVPTIGAVPTGVITFYDGGTSLGTATLSGGVATLTLNNLSVATHNTLTASYSGDANRNASVSTAQTLTVAKANTTTSLTATPSATQYNNNVTFTATVSATGPVATGTVTFFDGATTLGVVTLSGSNSATFSLNTLSVATHSITASYSGDANRNASVSSVQSVNIAKAPTTTTMTASPATTTYGNSVLLTATVTGGGSAPTGTIYFSNGVVTLGTVALNGSGVATLTLSNYSAGTTNFYATYSGDTNRNASGSNATVVTINKASSATALSVSASSVNYGTALTLTATVTASPTMPTGSVTFYDGATSLGTASLNGSGVATLTTSSLLGGTHSLTANYAGNTNYNTSASSSQSVTVIALDPTVALALSGSNATYGDSVSFTATVAGTGPTPTGNVTFYNGATSLGTAAVNGSGIAVLTLSTLGAASYSITASYAGNGTYNPAASSAQALVVAKRGTSTSLTTSSPTSTFGQTVVLTATVTSTVATPTGTVAFYRGGSLLGTSSLNGSGVALYMASTLPGGVNSVQAVYNGTVNYSVSASTAKTVTVSPQTTTTTVSAPGTVGLGLPATITATVVGANTFPSGTVVFTVDGSTAGSGTLNASGVATFTTSSLALGAHTLSATYSGNGSSQTSASTTSTLYVATDTSSTALSASSTQITYPATTTLTATVTSSAPPVSGTVTFFDGTTALGTSTLDGSGQAVLTVSPTGGVHGITAVYNGDSTHIGSTSPAVSVTSNRDSASMSLAIPQTTVSQGATLTINATVSGSGAFPTGTVTIYNGTVAIASGTVNSSGVASIGVTTLTQGAYILSAVYSGDTNYKPATSSVQQVIVTAPNVLSLASKTVSETNVGTVTFTASIDASMGTATGTVTFKNGATVIGTASVSQNQAIFNWTPGPGTYDISAVYSGNLAPMTSAHKSVTLYTQSATVSSSFSFSNPGTTYGSTFTQTYTFTNQSGEPLSGMVTFYRDFVPLSNVWLNASGVATLVSNLMLTGEHMYYVTYAGSAGTSPSLAFPLTAMFVTTNKATSNTWISVPVALYGYTQLSATLLNSGFGSPTGTVQFFDGTTSLGTVTLVNSAATLSTPLSVGSHSLTAVYSGDANFFPFTSGATNTTVAKGYAQLSGGFQGSNTYGLTTATLSAAPLMSGAAMPTGTYSAYEGGTLLATGALDAAGHLSLGLPTLGVGARIVNFSYSGDGNYNAQSNLFTNVTINVYKAGTSLITSAPSTFFREDATTLTATITPSNPNGNLPTGAVNLFDGATQIGTANLDAQGRATFSISGLSVGNHQFTTVYGGDANYNGSTSPIATALVRTNSVTSLAGTSAITYTGTASLTANVAIVPGALPTGSVTFFDGIVALGTAALNAAGAAQINVPMLLGGSHPITAVYPGDTKYSAGTSAPFNVVVAAAPSGTSLALASDSITFGDSDTFTATITGGGIMPTGTAEFFDGLVSLGVVTLDAGGAASITSSTIGVGSHTISVTYSGDGNYASSSASASLEVAKADSTSTLDTPSSSSFGDSVSLTASVSATASSGTPTGNVEFFDGIVSLGVVSLNGSGIALLSSSAFAVGSHTLTAVYSGEARYNASVSSAQPLIITTAPTTTVVTATPSPAILGQIVTLSAAVTSIAGTPTGMVEFFDGGTSLGAATLDAGGASISAANLGVGAHSITAVYSGDSNFAGGASPAQSLDVNRYVTAATLNASPVSTSFGDEVMFTASITSPDASPTGTVELFEGEVSLGSASLDENGIAMFTTTLFEVGTHSITAVYSGDENCDASTSSAADVTIVQAGTATQVVADNSPTVFGQAVVLTATVTASSQSGEVTGSVEFFDGAASLGTATISNGSASLTTTSRTTGVHNITAAYAGDTNHLASDSDSQTVTVSKTNAQVSLTVDPALAAYGQLLAPSVSITTVAGTAATGDVTLYDGVDSIATATLDGSGHAVFSLSGALPVGVHTLLVSYSGDDNYTPATGQAELSISKADVATTLGLSTSAAAFGDSITMTASVAHTADAPTGTVEFFDGPVSLGVGTLDSNGVASITTSAFATGGHSITASFSGDSNYNPSDSTAHALTIAHAATTTTASVLSATTSFGDAVTVTATVTSAPATPTGTVEVFDGAVSLGSATLNANGIATFTTALLGIGTHSITATYSGDENCNSSTSSAAAATVIKAGTATQVAADNEATIFGQAVVLTATITASSQSGNVTGNVEFFDGAASLGIATISNGNASLTTASLDAGAHSITAVYSGDAHHAASMSGTATQSVAQAQTASSVVANNSVVGNAATLTASVITLAPGAGLPTGSVEFFDGGTSLGSATLNGAGNASISVTSLAVGSHSITVVYSGDVNHAGATSAAATQAVSRADSTGSMTVNNATTTYGQSVTFTATFGLTTGAAAISGTVEFFDGAVSLGSSAIGANGIATCTIALNAGAHSVTATYSGNGNITGSVTSAVSATVNAVATTASLSVLPATVQYGHAITFTATIGTAVGTPTGTVTFYNGAIALGTAAVAAGVATFTTDSLDVASYSLTASYSGDNNHFASSSTVRTFQVIQSTVAVALTSDSPITTQLGQPITFTAVVATTGAGIPSGLVRFTDNAYVIGTATLDANGTATFPAGVLSFGYHPIAAVYLGDAHFVSNVSNQIVQQVIAGDSSTSLALNVSNSVYGESVTLTANVTTLIPSVGTVKFFDSTTWLGDGTVDASGVASLSIATLSAGSHSLTAEFHGVNGNFNTSTSAAQTLTVAKATPTVILNSSSPGTVWGAGATFTATVTGPVSGYFSNASFTMYANGHLLSGVSGSNLPNGQTLTHTAYALNIGDNTITAEFSGDSNHNPVIATITHTVSKGETATTIVSAVVNQDNPHNVFVTANVASIAPAVGFRTGTVTLYEGATVFGSGQVNSNGDVLINLLGVSPGIHNITAVYGGDDHYTGSTSAPLSVAVGVTTSSLALSNATINFNSSVTLTATITSSYLSAVTGTVTFYDGAASIGTGTLNASGQASLTSSTFTGGTHALTVVYNGNATFATSTSAAQTLTVNKINAATTLTVGATSSNYGQSVSLSATVTASGGTPTGTVTFYDGATPITTIALNGSGVAAGSVANLAVGSHSITAIYNGNTNLNSGPQTAVKSLTVSKTNTTTTLAVSPTSAQIGTMTTFTATITRAYTGGNQVTGTVSFKDGSTVFATVAVDANGIATYSRNDLTIANHTISAVYNGDASYNTDASSNVTVTTTKAATTSGVTLSASNVDYATVVTLTATVTSIYPGPIGGTVTFKDGSTTLGTATLDANGQATFVKNNFTPGSHSITVVYGGNTTYLTSTSAASVLTVNKLATVSNMSLSTATSTFGSNVTMTAQMDIGAAGWPTGNVTFYDGGVSLGNANLNSTGKATLTKNNLARGTHSIYYIYNGDTFYLTSTSDVDTLTVI